MTFLWCQDNQNLDFADFWWKYPDFLIFAKKSLNCVIQCFIFLLLWKEMAFVTYTGGVSYNHPSPFAFVSFDHFFVIIFTWIYLSTYFRLDTAIHDALCFPTNFRTLVGVTQAIALKIGIIRDIRGDLSIHRNILACNAHRRTCRR